jgi:hypothetical protein
LILYLLLSISLVVSSVVERFPMTI